MLGKTLDKRAHLFADANATALGACVVVPAMVAV